MKNFMKILKYVWPWLKPNKRIILLFVAVFFVDQMIEMANSYLLGTAIDNMLLAGTKSAIMQFAAMFLGLNVFSFVICYFVKVGGQKASEVARLEAKRQITRHIEETSLAYCGSMGSMTFMQRLNYDSAMLVFFVINNFGQMPSAFLSLLIALVVIIRFDIVCGIVAIIEIPIIIGLYMVFKKPLLERNEERAQRMEESNRHLYELLADVKYIKINQIFSMLEKRYKTTVEATISATVKTTQIEYVYSIINNNMDVFLKVFLFFYGGSSVISGKMTVGNFMVIYSYFTYVTKSCTYFLNLGKEIQEHNAYYERLKEISDFSRETNGTILLPSVDKIELSHIKFGYNETETILHDFTHTFQKGNLYAIVGGNGCGKSTLVSLLVGMYIDECQGDITYNGHSIKELDMRTLRKERIGVCEQEPYLIEDTIRYNMIYSNNTAEDETLMKLAYQVSFDDFLRNSEQGLDTLVGEGGNSLSGGQKQKTALVKVFYKNPDVLVLDEPTSAMDAEGQERLINYLTGIKKDKIIIVITHDERMMMAADEVVRL